MQKKYRIEIAASLKKQLQDEFNCSHVTVNMSLAFIFNSEQAVAIRNRAKELMELEIKKIDDLRQ